MKQLRLQLRLRLLLVIGLLFVSADAWAACSGSGVTWTCPAGATIADVNDAIGNSSDGATITFSNGAYTWNQAENNTYVTLLNSKGTTLICESVGGCTIDVSYNGIGMTTLAGTNTFIYRISGFQFTQLVNGQYTIRLFGYADAVMQNLRIDHNTFLQGATSKSIALSNAAGATNVDERIYGVIDHNSLHCPVSCAFLYYANELATGVYSSTFGTGNNLFVEDNTLLVDHMDDAGDSFTDGWGIIGVVERFNSTTCGLYIWHGTTHGGPLNIEHYGNAHSVDCNVDIPDFYGGGNRLFHHQGSAEIIAWNNTFTPKPTYGHGDALNIQNYRSSSDATLNGSAPFNTQCDGTQSIDANTSPTATWRGYPCKIQPGRDSAFVLKPIYLFMNTWTDDGSKVSAEVSDVGGNPDYYSIQNIENRDFYDSVSVNGNSSPTSPFDGTTGVGFGTLANRPTTCTPTTSTLPGDATYGGVGYFAVDQGSWNTNSAHGYTVNGMTYYNGVLYRCDSTNHWTTAYTPYTYPHPLVDSSPSLGAASPSSLAQGASSDITITGFNLSCTTAVIAVSGTGITVTSPTCVNASTLTAHFAVSGGATVSSRSITATLDGTPGTGSTPFNVTSSSCTPDHLLFTSQPSSAVINATVGAVAVGIYDSGNILCTSATNAITLSKGSGATWGSLATSTNLTQSPTSGASSWSSGDLTVITTTGSGFISAAASGLTGANSNSITISAVPVGGGGVPLIRALIR